MAQRLLNALMHLPTPSLSVRDRHGSLASSPAAPLAASAPAQPQTQSQPTPQAAARIATAAQRALAERARQQVAQRLDDPPTVAELCARLGVSRRTLQSCFHLMWGMGPLAWLNTQRLNAVRQRLQTATSVTEAATQFGYWHFGHFADDYRALFGELPSETLRRHSHGGVGDRSTQSPRRASRASRSAAA